MQKNELKSGPSVDKAGVRLNLILDHVSFPAGFGRQKALFELLQASSREAVSSLGYSTIRHWFSNDSLPHIKKIEMIMSVLLDKYPCQTQSKSLAIFWKIGGICPFNSDSPKHSIEMIVSSIVMKLSNGDTSKIDASKLEEIKKSVSIFCEMFADPNETKPPSVFIEQFIKGALN